MTSSSDDIDSALEARGDLDLSAWQPPDAPDGLADVVVARARGTAIERTLLTRPRDPRVAWLAAAGAAASMLALAGVCYLAITRDRDDDARTARLQARVEQLELEQRPAHVVPLDVSTPAGGPMVIEAPPVPPTPPSQIAQAGCAPTSPAPATPACAQPAPPAPLTAPVVPVAPAPPVEPKADPYQYMHGIPPVRDGSAASAGATPADPAAGPGTLRVECDPVAHVAIDGTVVGDTPWSGHLPAGKHKVTYQIGLDRYSFWATIRPDETVTMTKSFADDVPSVVEPR
jgi:hypothetical protein|nr:hypothetical protein [Kofleriaceae bacterium]